MVFDFQLGFPQMLGMLSMLNGVGRLYYMNMLTDPCLVT